MHYNVIQRPKHYKTMLFFEITLKKQICGENILTNEYRQCNLLDNQLLHFLCSAFLPEV